jgi:thiol-disulfide isomerase/thioredoxin
VYRGAFNETRAGRAWRFPAAMMFSRWQPFFKIFGALLISSVFGASVSYGAQPVDLRAATEPAGPLFKLDEFRGGGPLSLADQRGKIVLLHFFATYCEPCRPEMASLNRFLKANTDKPFAVFAVDVGEIDLKVRAFFEKEPVDFPVVLDRDRKISKAWGVYALPTTIVLNDGLKPVLIVEGDLDWSHPEVIRKLEILLPVQGNRGPRTGG